MISAFPMSRAEEQRRRALPFCATTVITGDVGFIIAHGLSPVAVAVPDGFWSSLNRPR